MARRSMARTLGRFEIRSVLGAGAAGDVYEAWDRDRETLVALKTLRRLTGQSLYRFKAEFRSILGIQHPNLVRLGELLVEDGLWFFTMEIVRGQTLREHLRLPRAVDVLGVRPEETAILGADAADPEDERAAAAAAGALPPPYSLDESRLRAVLPQVADVVHAIHEAGKLHRDIKPSNVLVEEVGRAVLMDFGLVHELAAATNSQVEFAGTPGYMAPEQARGIVGTAADWYAFGSLLYQALTGRLPFEAATARDLLSKKQAFAPPPPQALNPAVPDDLDRLCEDLLAIDPGARPTGAQVLARLGAAPTSAVSVSGGQARGNVPFVGRATELARLREAFDDMRSSRGPVAVVVDGESGVGKSELVRRFVDRLEAEGDGVVSLRGRCYERESVPFKAFDGLVDALSRFLVEQPRADVDRVVPANAGLLTRLFPVLGRVAVIAESASEVPDVEPRELRKRAFRALRETLANIASRNSLVLVVDDLQWSDRESLELLEEIVHPEEPIPLLLVLTARSDSRIAIGPGSDSDLCVPIDLRRVELGALDDREARELIALVGGRDAEADAVIAETGGHPLFLVEMARHAAAASGATDADRIVRLDDALWSRAQSLDRTSRSLLELLAVAGAPLPMTVVRCAVGEDVGELDRAADSLRAQQLARSHAAGGKDELETYHDRVRQAVAERLGDDASRTVHARLAVAMMRFPDAVEPTALVFHLEGAGRLQEAAENAQLAGEHASSAFAYGKAAELFETAMRLGRWSPERERQLLVARAHALTNAGQSYAGADLFLRAAARTDAPDESLQLRLLGAEQLLMSGRIDDGLEVMTTVQASVGIARRRTRVGALLSLLWNRMRLRMRGLDWEPRDAADISAADLRRFDVYKACADNLGLVDPIRGAEFQSRALLWALELGESVRVGRSLAVEATFLAAQGSRTRARSRDVIEVARRIADGAGDPHLDALTTTVTGVIDYFDSRLEPAVETLERGERLFRDVPGEVWGKNGARIFLMFALRLKGEVGRLASCYDEFVRDADARGDHYLGTMTRRAGAIVWLARDDVGRARAELERVRWAPPDRTFHLQHYYEVEALIDLALYAGELGNLDHHVDRLARLRRSLIMRVQTTRCLAAWLHGRAALAWAVAAGDSRGGLSPVRAAISRLDREGLEYASLWAQLLRAGLANLEGRRDRAIEELRAANTRCQDGGYRSLAGAVQLRLADLTDPDDSDRAALESAGRAALEAQGVQNPARFAATLVPGLG